MAVGLLKPSAVYPVSGIELATVATGMRYQGRDDLLLMTLSEGSTVSAVFTQNKCCAAPVTLAKANFCLLYTSPSPRDLSTSRMPSSA